MVPNTNTYLHNFNSDEPPGIDLTE